MGEASEELVRVLQKRSVEFAQELKLAKSDLERLTIRLNRDLKQFKGASIKALNGMPRELLRQYLRQMAELGIVSSQVVNTDDVVAEFDKAMQHKSLDHLRFVLHGEIKNYLKDINNLPEEEKLHYCEERINQISLSLTMFELTEIFEVQSDTRTFFIRHNPPVDEYRKIRDVLIATVESVKQKQPSEVEVNFETTAEKITWLHELGIISLIVEKCSVNNSTNVQKAAKIISSISNLNLEQTRKCLEAILRPNPHNQKNNPLSNPKNKAFVGLMKEKFRIK